MEFYDCEDDPNEWINLAESEEHQPQIKTLSALLPSFEPLPDVGGKKAKK